MTLQVNCKPRFEIFSSQVYISTSGQQTRFYELRMFFKLLSKVPANPTLFYLDPLLNFVVFLTVPHSIDLFQ